MTETKTCRDCGDTKSVDEFAWKQKGVRRHPYCKPCGQVRSRRHYRDNAPARIAQVTARKQALGAARRAELLADAACVRCGTEDPAALGAHVHAGDVKDVLHGSRERFVDAVLSGLLEVRCRACATVDGHLRASAPALPLAPGAAFDVRLRAAMLLANVAAKDLAATLGVAEPTVSRWRRGHVAPRDEAAVLAAVTATAA